MSSVLPSVGVWTETERRSHVLMGCDGPGPSPERRVPPLSNARVKRAPPQVAARGDNRGDRPVCVCQEQPSFHRIGFRLISDLRPWRWPSLPPRSFSASNTPPLVSWLFTHEWLFCLKAAAKGENNKRFAWKRSGVWWSNRAVDGSTPGAVWGSSLRIGWCLPSAFELDAAPVAPGLDSAFLHFHPWQPSVGPL